jgi:hypothetical protein
MIHASPSKGFALGPAFAYFVIAYVLVTILAAALTIAYGTIHQLPEAAPGQSMLEAPAFVATVPYHVLIMVLVWPVFAWLYFRKRMPGPRGEARETFALGLLWLLAAMIVDFVGFVLIDNPWSMTPHEFYVVYQPWISLIYLAIFASPWIHLTLKRLWIQRRAS